VKANWREPLDLEVAEEGPLVLARCPDPGWELAGTRRGNQVMMRTFKLGIEVFGMLHLSGDGADAEFAVGGRNRFALKPAGRFPAAGPYLSAR